MRLKKLWEIFPLPAKIKLIRDRITFTKTTTVYFVFSALHCAIQVIFQVQAFQINVQAANFLTSILEQGGAVSSYSFYVLGNNLRLCAAVPASSSTSSCQVIWDGMVGNNTLIPTSSLATVIMEETTGPSPVMISTSNNSASSIRPPDSGSSSAPITINNTNSERRDGGIFDGTAVVKGSMEVVQVNGTTQVVVNGFGWDNESAILDKECLWTLGWSVQILRNTKREDLTFIMFQIWLLGMSIVAILNESVPHTIASLQTHLVATGWAGYQIYNTAQFRSDFAELTTNGACHPVDLLPTYWQTRSAAEIPSVILNAVALLISAFLSWRLAKSFGWQTFKRVGASPTISHVYKIVLTLSIVIQLSLFFIVTSVALWLDQLWNGAIGQFATSPVYRPLLILTLMLLPPWLASGWYSVRQERKIEMVIFLFMCLAYLVGWGAMFVSTAFRWTYMLWTFFGVMTTTSVFLTLLALILGVICRLNFGKGLPHYLTAKEPAEEGFEPVIVGDPEKVAFSSSSEQTISVAFGIGTQAPSTPQAINLDH